MQVSAVWTDKSLTEDYIVLLRCGCTIYVPEAALADPDFPCPLHEEGRFFQDLTTAS
jgi:hypothetical protein